MNEQGVASLQFLGKIYVEINSLRFSLITGHGARNRKRYIKNIKRLVKEYRKRGYDEEILQRALKKSQIAILNDLISPE